MVALIAEYDAALADKPCLAEIYDENWRRKIRPQLLGSGSGCCLGNAFGYQAPWLERSGLVRKGWQAKLEEGAGVLLPRLSKQERGHLVKRMRDTESTSAEEEILLAGGFSREFGAEAIELPEGSCDQPRAEFEVNADGARIIIEAKGRLVSQSVEQEREQNRAIERQLGIKIPDPPPLDDKVDRWIENKFFKTLRSKSKTDCGMILVMSLYTLPGNFLALIDQVRGLAACPGNPACLQTKRDDLHLAEEHRPLAIALVSGGSIQGVWFNLLVRDRLGIDTTTEERIRVAIKESFFPREDGVFFHEGLSDEDHAIMIHKMPAFSAQ